MLQTLFFIPHWFLDGYLLLLWIVCGVVYLAVRFARGQFNDAWGFIPVLAIVGLAIHFVIPGVEVDGIDPADPEGPLIKHGLAVRGYGVMLLTAIVSGVGMAMWRCEKIGVTRDQILQLAFWMMVCGIAGARLFFVIQKSNQFFPDGFSLAALPQVFNMTQGGLVVYGSLIGGIIAGLVFLKINQMPLLKTADVIAPGMVLGLAIGRIGCLMNGCCFGGVCEANVPAVTFPAGSPPYMRQLIEGNLIGIQASYDASPETNFPIDVQNIAPGSFAQEAGFQPGDRLRIRTVDSLYLRFKKNQPGGEANPFVAVINSNDGRQISVPLDKLPHRSARTQPTQIYSAVNALLLCGVLWFFWTVKKFDGQVFALMLILYPIARFLMEIVRQDERGQFGTILTISQWVSCGMVLLGFVLFAGVSWIQPVPQAAENRPDEP